MVEQKMCRLCMTKENLTSLWGKADGEKISEKIFFTCGIKIISTDPFPKFICHQCLSFIIIGSSFKRKSLETEKIMKDQFEREVESISLINEKDDNEQDDPFYTDTRETIRSKFLIYEENPENDDQPKISYHITESSIKIRNTKHFENPELKSFLDGYLAAKPNLEIIKVVNPETIQEIEKVVDENNELKNPIRIKRPRNEIVLNSPESQGSYQRSMNVKQKPSSQMMQHSKLLSALAGQRFSNVNISRISSSPLFNNQDSNNYKN
ncbi:uncharacterized protein [Chironomus tepperi]|uniref:uncharacterized protein n=1 Tax=Chironomus tepperi TaxID=113505 RepID=UPI00391FBB66